jgi:WD40 repeat protein
MFIRSSQGGIAKMSGSPYPGLRPFERHETDIFFGREEHIDELIEKLENEKNKENEQRFHFVAVLGPSGCGKSSLVRTGLLASLEAGFAQGAHWWIVESRPGNQPFFNLAEAFLKRNDQQKDLDSQLTEYQAGFSQDMGTVAELTRKLHDNPQSLHQIFQHNPLPENRNLLILIDQFEELFRYSQEGGIDQEAGIKEVTKFIAWLLASCQHDNVYVVITMRSEFSDRCTQFHDLPEALNQGTFMIPRMKREQLKETIEYPARVFEGQVEPELVDRLLDDMGNHPDQLPLMEHLLMRMWWYFSAGNNKTITLTLEYYEKIGGFSGALSKSAEEEAYANLNHEQQRIAEILFRSLSEYDRKEDNYVRRPAKLEEVATLANTDWRAVAEVVEEFRRTRRRFLTPPYGIKLERNNIIDISHESLIRQWPRLRDWAKAEAKIASFYKHLEERAILWKEGETALLLRTPDLENALKWRTNVQEIYTTPDQLEKWARSRYGEYFDFAIEFLEASQTQQKKEQQQAKKAKLLEVKRQNDFNHKRQQLRWAIAGVILATGMATWGFWERHNAQVAQQHAEQGEKQRIADLFESQRTHAALLIQNEDYVAAKNLLEKTRHLDREIAAPHRHARNSLAWFSKVMSGEPQQVYKGAGAVLYAVAISPDGQSLAVAGENGTLVLFNAYNGQLLQRLKGHTDHVWATVFGPKNQWLASAGDDKQIIFWSLPAGEKLKEWQTEGEIWALAVNPEGTILASGGKNKTITLWNIQTGQTVRTLKGHQQEISSLAFDATGEILASSSYDKAARLWQVSSGETIKTLQAWDKIQEVAFSSNDQLLAIGGNDNKVRLWDVNSGQQIRTLDGHQNKVFDVNFINEDYLVSSSADRSLRIWDVDNGLTVRVLQGHSGNVTGIATHQKRLFSVSTDGTAMRWDTSLPYQYLVDLPSEPASTAISPNGHRVAVGFADGTLRLYSLPEIQLLWEQDKVHQRDIQRLAFSSDSRLLASASLDKTVKLWQVTETKLHEQHTIEHKDGVTAAAFAPDNKTLVTASYDGQIGLFTIATKKTLFYKAHEGKEINSVVFGAQGTKLLTADDHSIRLWNFNDFHDSNLPKPLQELPKVPAGILWAALSQDGQRYASVGRNYLVNIHATDNGQLQYSLVGHENSILRAIFSPDSQQVATVSGDATVRFWDLINGSELFTLRLPTQSNPPAPLWDFDFRCTPTGCWIAVPLTRGQLMLYELGQIYD